MGIWDELGIAQTEDRAAIRRAYAVRLKATRPEDDPEGFRRLRSAYDRALAGAAQTAEPVPNPPPQPSAPLPPEPVAAPDPIPPPPADAEPADIAQPPPVSQPPPITPPPPPPPPSPPSDAARRIEAALARREVAAAAAELAAARGGDAMSLTEEMTLADQLLLALVHDRALPGLAVFEAATTLGWYGFKEEPNRSPLLNRLHARIEAERWLAQLQAQARSWRRCYGSQRSAAARLLLGRGSARLAALLPPEPPLRRTLAEFHLHQGWIGDRLDADRIDAVERIAARRYTRHAARIWLCLMFLPIMVVGAAKTAGGVALLFWWASGWLRSYARPILIVMVLSTLAILLTAS